MSETAARLLEQLLTLPEADRVLVADRLWESLSDEKRQELAEEATSDPEFLAELERRLEQVEKHPEQLLDGEQVMAELRERYRRKTDS